MSALSNIILFMVRRMIMATIVVFLYSYPIGQISLTIVSSLLLDAYFFHVRPLESKVENWMAIFNEASVSISAYHLFILADLD